MTRIPRGRIKVSGFEYNGVIYRKLTKDGWGKLYRSMDDGFSWHRSTKEAFQAAYTSGKLQQLPQYEMDELAAGFVVLA
jgi:hypothetical protein